MNNRALIKKERLLGLDILRAIAILLVLHEHGTYLLPSLMWGYLMLPTPSLDGVSIFFVLSGFLIGTILLRTLEKTDFKFTDLKRFWLRRWIRTVPAYFFVVLILYIIHLFFIRDISYIDYRYFIFIQNFSSPHPNFFPEAWSLSVEEWFYLTFPLFVFLLHFFLKNKGHSILIAAILFLTVPLILRIFKASTDDSLLWDVDFRKIVVLRLDSIMYGVIGAYVSYYKNDFWIRVKKEALIISVVIVIFLLFYSYFATNGLYFRNVYHFNLESIAVLLSLPFFSQLRRQRANMFFKACTFLSLISYSMYLINLSLIMEILIPALFDLFNWQKGTSVTEKLTYRFTQYGLFWVLTIVCSFYMFKYIELPIMNLRDRFSI